MYDLTIRKLRFDLSWQQWSLVNHFCTEQGHCSACRRRWRLTDTDLCPCGETQTMFHIVESCLNGGLSRLLSADEDAVSWLTNYGSRHAYEKKKTTFTSYSSPHYYINHIIIFTLDVALVVAHHHHFWLAAQSAQCHSLPVASTVARSEPC